MTQPAKSQEPSMEEILASIRRIIADDDPTDPAHDAGGHVDAHAPHTARVAPPPDPPDTAFDTMLARLHASSRPPVSAPQDQEPVERTAEPPEFAPGNDGSDEETFEAPGAPPRARRRAEERFAIRDAREQGLISPATAAAVDAALNTLAEAVQVRNGRTLEEVVTELLRPMLKTWLDDNLPLIVERLVRAEIERMTRNR